MKHELTKIERLDWAARAMATARLYSWVGIFFIWWPVARMWSEKDYYHWAHGLGTWTYVVVVGIAPVPTVLIWLRNRYSILAIGLAYVLMGVSCALLMSPKSHTPFDRIFYNALSLFWVGFGFWFVRQGIQLAAVYTPGWEMERDQAEQWLLRLQRNERDDKIFEFYEKGFYGGGRTHRILNAHYCWVVATFRTGKEDGLPLDYRVREPVAITLLEQSGGPSRAIVNGRMVTSNQE
jgi:hypothetical protein